MGKDRQDKLDLADRDQALRWWKERADRDEVVIPRVELPRGPGRRFLLKGGFAAEIASGQAWILKAPDRPADRELCLRNYWRIVSAVFRNYEPAVVERESAVRLYLEETTPPQRLRVRHASSASRYTFELCDELEVQLTSGDVSLDRVRRMRVDTVELSVDRPERTLLALPLSIVRDHLEEIAVWLSSLIISRPALEEEWENARRPVLLRRFAEMARDAGNERLYHQLDDFLEMEHGRHVSRARAGVGSEIVVPSIVSRVRSSSAWLARHAARFHRFAHDMNRAIGPDAAELPTYGRADLSQQAREARAYDAYHSTTIEGYRITPEEVSAVLRGQEVGGHDPEQVRSRMAVRGYSLAFDRCLATIRSARDPVEIREDLVHELYMDLFSPSVEAGIIEADVLRGWRAATAYLRGSRYVPPSPDKVPQLMQQHLRLINEWEGPAVTRAVAAHLDFVAIHPFPDGNGRIARFLMNLILLSAGYPWVTIRTDDRIRYFEGLETATVHGDARPFARFVFDYIENAVGNM